MRVEQYIEFVGEVIDKYKNLSAVNRNMHLYPADLMNAQGEYCPIYFGMLSEYQRYKIEFQDLEEQYGQWYDEKFEEAVKSVKQDYLDNKSIKPSVKEFEVRLRTSNRGEYSERQSKLKEAENKMRFYLRMMTIMDKFNRRLSDISNLMRSELKTFDLEIRTNQRRPMGG